MNEPSLQRPSSTTAQMVPSLCDVYFVENQRMKQLRLVINGHASAVFRIVSLRN